MRLVSDKGGPTNGGVEGKLPSDYFPRGRRTGPPLPDCVVTGLVPPALLRVVVRHTPHAGEVPDRPVVDVTARG